MLMAWVVPLDREDREGHLKGRNSMYKGLEVSIWGGGTSLPLVDVNVGSHALPGAIRSRTLGGPGPRSHFHLPGRA